MTVTVLPRVLGQPIFTNERSAEQRTMIAIADAMQRTCYQPLRKIDLSFEGETVVLLGVVPTYFLKQLAQVVVMSVSGVERIDNQLRVAEGQPHQPEPALELTASVCVREATRSHCLAMLANA